MLYRLTISKEIKRKGEVLCDVYLSHFMREKNPTPTIKSPSVETAQSPHPSYLVKKHIVTPFTLV